MIKKILLVKYRLYVSIFGLISFSIISFDITAQCDVTQIDVDPETVCLDQNETATFTITGTPNATVDYTVGNGMELDDNPIDIGASGMVTIEVEPLVAGDITIFINDVSLGTCNNTSPTENFAGFLAETEADLDVTSITVDNEEVCLDGNSLVTFSIEGSPNGDVNFTITNGSSSVSSPLNLDLNGDGSIAVLPDSEGLVTLEILSVEGQVCVNDNLTVSTESFMANPLPAVTITGTDPTICGQEGQITIDNLVSGDDYVIMYSPDEGDPSSGETFTASGSSQVISIPSGIYVFTEIENETTGCISALDDIIALEDPAGSQANINGNSTQGPICVGDDITFIINTTAPSATVEYQIDNGSSQFVTTIGNTASISINDVQSEDVTIELISVTLNGCVTNLSESLTVEVLPLPTVTSLSNSGPHCEGENGSFLITGTPNTAVTYRLNNGPNQSIQISANGQANLTGIVTTTTIDVNSIEYNNTPQCNNAQNQSSTISFIPRPSSPTTNGNFSICQGNSNPTLSVSSVPGAIVNWYAQQNGGSPIQTNSTSYTPPPSIQNPGTYNYYAESVLSEAGVQCSSGNRTELSFTIISTPPPPVAVNSTVEICLGEVIPTLQAVLPAGLQNSTINWYDSESNGQLLTVGNSYTPMQAVTKTYWVETIQTHSNNLQCTSASRTPVTLVVNPLPQVNATADQSTICDYEAIILRAEGDEGSGNFSYRWDNGSIQSDITIMSADPGNNIYGVTVTDSKGCQAFDQVNVFVNRSPIAKLEFDIYNRDVILDDFRLDPQESDIGDGNIESIDWIFSPAIFYRGQERTSYQDDCCNIDTIDNLEVRTAGIYKVRYRLSDSNGCFSETDNVIQEFFNQDDCRVSTDVTQICVGELTTLNVNYTPSTPGTDLNNIKYRVKGGPSVGEVTFIGDKDFEIDLRFFESGIQKLEVEINEFDGCNETRELSFNVSERARIDLLSINPPDSADVDVDGVTNIHCDNVANDLILLNLFPEKGLITYSFENLDNTNQTKQSFTQEYNGNSFRIPYNKNPENDVLWYGRTRLTIESIAYRDNFFNNSTCETNYNNIVYEYIFEPCGADALVNYRPGSLGTQPLDICTNSFFIPEATGTVLSPQDEVPATLFYIVSKNPDLGNFIDLGIDDIYDSNNISFAKRYEIGDSIIIKDLILEFGLTDITIPLAVYSALNIPINENNIKLSNPRTINIRPNPNIAISRDSTIIKYCLNAIDVELYAIDTSEYLHGDFLVSWTGIDSSLFKDYLDNTNRDTTIAFLSSDFLAPGDYEINAKWTNSFDETTHTCSDSNNITITIGSNVALKPDTAFIKWFPGNILSTSFAADTATTYNYSWGKGEPGDEEIIGEDWFIIIDEKNFKPDGMPIDDNNKLIFYWVDVWTDSNGEECKLRLYYTGDGFQPKSSSDNNPNQSHDITVIPNPNDGQFSIKISGDIQQVRGLLISDAMGHNVLRVDKSDLSDKVIISDRGLSSGVYFAQLLFNSNEAITEKIVIVK